MMLFEVSDVIASEGITVDMSSVEKKYKTPPPPHLISTTVNTFMYDVSERKVLKAVRMDTELWCK